VKGKDSQMSGVKEKTTFTACDGREFKTREEAERYEVMKHADEELAEAVAKYNLTLAKALKTADGHPFAFGGSYYIVSEGANSESVHEEYLHARNTRVQFYDNGRDPAIFFTEFRGGDSKVRQFYLGDIYVKNRNAQLRVLEIRKKRLGWLMDDIAKLERELGIGQEGK
jgi:hypothetical protein